MRFLDQSGTELSRVTLARAANGDVNSTTDGCSNTTSFGYDSYGNQTSVTDPQSNQTTYTYDLGGRKLTETDPLSHTTTYNYDNQNNVLTVKDALNHTTTMTYDAKGNLSTVTDADSNVTTYHYDNSDHLTQVVDALNHTTGYAYDADGNRTSQTDANGKTTTYAYDVLNRLSSVTDPLNHATSYQYDPAGNQTQSTDADGLVTKQYYDAVNRLTSVEHWAGGTTLVDSASYGYDNKGNRTSVTDPNGKVTSYTYDAMDRLSKVTDPNNKVTSYGYDANSNRTSMNDANHQGTGRPRPTTYTYDSLNRLTNIQYPDANYYVGYGYDVAGRQTSMTETVPVNMWPYGTRTTTYAYDNANRLTSATASDTGAVSYTYDAAGNRTSITYPDGKTVTYTPDALNRIQSVSDWQTPANVSSYAYDPAGNLQTTTYPSSTGVLSTRTYDNASRLTSLVNVKGGNTLSSYAYTMDNVGNRTQVVDQNGTTTYNYDPLYRLTSVTYPGPSTTSYTYDAAGNRLTMTSGGSTTSYTYDNANELTQVGVGGTATPVPNIYDADGNWTQSGYGMLGPLRVVYDYENHPVRIGQCVGDVNGDGAVNVTDLSIVANHNGAKEGDVFVPDPNNPGQYLKTGYDYHFDLNGDGTINVTDLATVANQMGANCSDTANYRYDGNGLRIEKRQKPQTYLQVTDYVWDVAASPPVVVQEKSGSTVTNSYVYGADLLSETDNNNVTTYLLQDGLGSTTGLTNSSGSVTDTYTYDAFGATRTHTGTSSNVWKFTGEQNDVTVNQSPYYLRARYYDPVIGRFFTRDPILGNLMSPRSLNRYAYALNNPALLLDLLGLCASEGGFSDCSGGTPVPIMAPTPPPETPGPWAAQTAGGDSLLAALQSALGLIRETACRTAYNPVDAAICMSTLAVSSPALKLLKWLNTTCEGEITGNVAGGILTLTGVGAIFEGYEWGKVVAGLGQVALGIANAGPQGSGLSGCW